eukprot:7493073-Ditylum_brightwellii.AAC.1
MSESWYHLMLKKEDVTWKKTDGTEIFYNPTLIWVILTTLKPTRNVGVQAEVKAIKSAKLTGYCNVPLKMLHAMELKFNQIRDLSGETVFTTKQFTNLVFRAFLTRMNQSFKQYDKGKKGFFDEGK